MKINNTNNLENYSKMVIEVKGLAICYNNDIL